MSKKKKFMYKKFVYKKFVYKKFVYLGSQSISRQNLLKSAQIDYKILTHKSDECVIPKSKDFNNYVLDISKDKMANIDTNNIINNNNIFVLTADTLVQTKITKQILPKPQDIKDAHRMLDLLCKENGYLATGCCLHKKKYNKNNNSWVTVDKREWVTNATIEFCVEKEFRDKYFEKLPDALKACGASIIEEYGLNFLKKIDGSFTAVIGLPIFELRKNLLDMGF